METSLCKAKMGDVLHMVIIFNYISVIDKTNYIIDIIVNICKLYINAKRRLIYLAIGTLAFMIAFSAGA